MDTNTDSRPLKEHLGHCRFQNNEEVEIAVREWLLMPEPDFYHGRIFNLCQHGTGSGIMSKNNDTSAE
jgi:hypothetical protein